MEGVGLEIMVEDEDKVEDLGSCSRCVDKGMVEESTITLSRRVTFNGGDCTFS